MDFEEEVLRVAAELTTWSVGPGPCGVQAPGHTLEERVPQGFRSALSGIGLHRKVPTPKGLREHLGDQLFGA